MKIAFLAVAVLALAACSENLVPSGPLEGPGAKLPTDVNRQALLTTYPACASLEAAVKAKLVAVMRANFSAGLKSALEYYRAGESGWGFADAGTAGGGGGAGTTGPADVTGTNVQVAGVDEPDIIKNDGNRIFVLSKGRLFASRSWPAADLAVQGSLAIAGTPAEMFLDGDRVVVFSTHWLQGGRGTFATLIDVSTLASPKVVGQYEVPGNYRSARRIGKSVRLITNRDSVWPAGVTAYFSYWSRNKWSSETEILAEYARLLADNEKKINAAVLNDLLPAALWHGQQDVAFNVDCASVHLSTGVTAPGYSEIATFQTDVDAQLNRQVLFELADEVYANGDSLYFTSRHWWWSAVPVGLDATYIHKFDTSAPGAAKYVGTGVIDGSLVDQFSIDEWKGNLRLASTVTDRTANWSANTWNEVVVLATVGTRLVEIGKSAKLAPGERVTSARFIGDVGYVVTFRQTDPLFVFDLKDPTHPKKVGELKVPGFSSYIHPLDSNHLLTIGTYIPETGSWRDRAVQLAIFDVSDLTAPKQTHLQLLGNYTASSEAQWQHKAFNYFPSKKLLAVPFHEWSYGMNTNGTGYWYELKSELRVFEVDAVQGFTSRGALSMSDLGTRTSYYASDAIVRRSVMADDVVYAISEAGIRVANVNALDTPLATAKF